MAIAFVNSASTTHFTSPVSVTYSPTAGHLLVAWVVESGSPASTYSIADNGSGTVWTTVFQQQESQVLSWANAYYTCSAGSGITSISASITSGSTNDVALIVAEFSGAATASCLDSVDSGTTGGNNTGPATSASISPRVTNEVVVGLFDAASAGGPFTTSGSWTLAASQAHNGGGVSGMTYQVVTSATAYTAQATMAGSARWNGNALTFEPPQNPLATDEDFWAAPAPAPVDTIISVF